MSLYLVPARGPCSLEAAVFCSRTCGQSKSSPHEHDRQPRGNGSIRARQLSSFARRFQHCSQEVVVAVTSPERSKSSSPAVSARKSSSSSSQPGLLPSPSRHPRQALAARSEDASRTSFHTSAVSLGPSTSTRSESAATTIGSPSKATFDLLAWWNRTMHFSASSAARQGDPQSEPSTRSPPKETRDPSSMKQQSNSSSPEEPVNNINYLMRQPDIFENIKIPRHPIVLCHGLYGFDVRGPFLGLSIHYWAAALDILRNKIGAEVIVRGVPGTGSISSRAEALHKFLSSEEAEVRGRKLNFVGHSMGGLDGRYLISQIKPKPEEYVPVSLTTICAPHLGSPFMDWCNANVGIGNDYVEEAIQEYEAEQKKKRTSLAEGQDHAGAAAKADEASKLPYSLKSPLFVRPKKNGQNGEQVEGQDQRGSSQAQASSKSAEAVIEEKTKRSDGVVEQDVTEKVQDALSSAAESVKDAASTSPAKLPKALSFVSPLTKTLSSFGGVFSSYMLSMIDTPAYAMLSTRYMARVFNPSTPDSPDVAYFSVAARTRKIPLWHPLWLPKVILDAAAESRTAASERDGSAAALGNPETQGNDGLVSVQSARWGQFLGVVEDRDHWDLRGSGAPKWGINDKVNLATGKPLKKGAVLDQGKDDPAQKGKKEESWLTINRLLGAWIGKRDAGQSVSSDVKDGNAAEKESSIIVDAKDQLESALQAAADVLPSQESAKGFLDHYANVTKPGDPAAAGQPNTDTPKSNQNETGLIDEVASWISDRLPQGSEERRKLADEAAQQQEATMIPFTAQYSTANSNSSSESLSAWSGSDYSSIASDSSMDSTDSNEDGKTLASGPSLGQDPVLPPLPQVSASVSESLVTEQQRADVRDSKQSVAQSEDEGDGASVEERKRKKKERSEKEELERFWIALCQHLHSHGF